MSPARTAWRPSASVAALRARADFAAAARGYFAAQGVLEVTTPALVRGASTEPTLDNLVAGPAGTAPPWFLRTSPEAAMKRLLAAGSGDIYQLGPAFRADERGRHHLVEFTLLEWYRLGFDLRRLMDDVEGLLRAAGFSRPIARLRYADLFAAEFGQPPHALDTAALAALVERFPIVLDPADLADRALLFDCLYTAALEPRLAAAGAVFIYDFPDALRAYARLHDDAPGYAARCELVVDGLELANGYHEVTDAAEQAACFAAENAVRARRGRPAIAADQAWLDALGAGMPPCAGVALGVERLLMVLGHGDRIDAVAAFADELAPDG